MEIYASNPEENLCENDCLCHYYLHSLSFVLNSKVGFALHLMAVNQANLAKAVVEQMVPLLGHIYGTRHLKAFVLSSSQRLAIELKLTDDLCLGLTLYQ